MQAAVIGVLTDYEGRVLLKQSGDSVLVPIRAPLGQGQMPPATLDSAFREATGLIVMPVRLTGVYYDAGIPGGEMAFVFRCTMRGGDLQIPQGGSPAGFFDIPPLPPALSPEYRRQIDTALHHPGGPPVMEQVGGLGTRLGRLFGRREAATDSIDWGVSVRAIQKESDGSVEWAVVDSDDYPEAMTSPAVPGQAPWITATRLMSVSQPGWTAGVRLARVEIAAARPALTMVFAPTGL